MSGRRFRRLGIIMAVIACIGLMTAEVFASDMVDISDMVEISCSKTRNYTGKAVKPKIVAVYINGEEISSDYYDVSITSLKNNKKIGTAKFNVKLLFKNGLEGYYATFKGKTFKIVPKPTEITRSTRTGSKVKVKWKKKTTQTTGYRIKVYNSSGSKKLFTKTIKSNKTTSFTTTKMKKNKKYYVEIQTYKKVGSKKYYSEINAYYIYVN